jgi:acetoin utilization deacetylase AcuC-like enzyme
MAPKTAVVKDPVYLQHKNGDYHPESHHRLEVVYEMLRENELQGKFSVLAPRPATRAELELNHSPDYIDQVAATAGRDFTSLDPDTSTSPRSWEAAQMAAGGVLEAIDRVMQGEFENCFALVRPPGHHAEKGWGKGFCLFNNIAVGAHYALKQYQLERILIVDWDLHHGNGTQHSFYSDPRVLFFSTHQYPYYPGSGSVAEAGEGRGEGFTVNVPLSGGQGDGDFLEIYRVLLKPLALEFKPQLVLVSAGFDIYFDDPLGGMEVTPEGFAALTSFIMDLAHSSCEGKMVLSLEGGYHLDGLRKSVKATILQLAGDPLQQRKEAGDHVADSTRKIIEAVRRVQKGYWKCL